VKICRTVIDILTMTFNKLSSKFYFPEAFKRQTAIKLANLLSIANVCLQHKSTFGVHCRTGSPGQLGLRVAAWIPGSLGRWVTKCDQFHACALRRALYLRKLQSAQNTAARLITGTRRSDHISPILRELYWLPVPERVKFKVACLVRQSLSEQAPLYLADDCRLVSESDRRSLRSADVLTCVVPRTLLLLQLWRQNFCSRWTSPVELSSSPSAA